MRRPANPLALAVLALLYERPMHPYEMSTTLRERHKEDSIKINYGSLYAVVESLEKKDLVRARERVRDGRRPERTVYELTDIGEQMLQQWLGELIAQPSRQFTDFEAALSLLPALPPEPVTTLLAERIAALRAETEEYEAVRASYPSFPRIFTIEAEYRAVLRAAELAFVITLRDEIAAGAFGGLDVWRRFHQLKSDGTGENMYARLQEEFDPDNTWMTP